MFQVILVADYCIDSALFSIMIFDTFSNLVGAQLLRNKQELLV